MGCVATILSLLFICAGAEAAEFPFDKETPPEIARLAKYTIPQGWEIGWSSDSPDPSVTLSRGFNTIYIILYGGKDSRYKTVSDFMATFPPPTWNGPTRELDTIKVGGTKTTLYSRRVTVTGDMFARESAFPMREQELCVVPAGERFFVLIYSFDTPLAFEPGMENAAPPFDPKGEEEWKEFLQGFKLRG